MYDNVFLVGLCYPLFLNFLKIYSVSILKIIRLFEIFLLSYASIIYNI